MNGSELEKVRNDPQCLAGLYRNLLKEYRLRIPDHLLLPPPPPQSPVEQAVVYSTLPQEYSTLTFRGEVVASGDGVEERSEVIYWHRGDMVIYYR